MRVNYLYDDNFENLGENCYGATKRIQTMHNKIALKPEVSTKMGEYIRGQVNNEYYIQINSQEARQEGHQLHFIRYNFVVSSTSSSMSSFTKVRMTKSSSMHAGTYLSLIEVTKPAPGVVPNLRGILYRYRFFNQFAVYDIRKFFRSVRISDRDSYLRIVCVPQTSFSSAPCSNPT